MPTAPCSTPAGARDLPADSCAEWLELFRELQIPVPLQTPAAPFDDLHLNAIGFFSGTSGHRRQARPAAGCRHRGGARRTRPGARRRTSRPARIGVARSWRAAAYFGRHRAVSAADALCPDLNWRLHQQRGALEYRRHQGHRPGNRSVRWRGEHGTGRGVPRAGSFCSEAPMGRPVTGKPVDHPPGERRR
jgi:hypothetical protein